MSAPVSPLARFPKGSSPNGRPEQVSSAALQTTVFWLVQVVAYVVELHFCPQGVTGDQLDSMKTFAYDKLRWANVKKEISNA